MASDWMMSRSSSILPPALFAWTSSPKVLFTIVGLDPLYQVVDRVLEGDPERELGLQLLELYGQWSVVLRRRPSRARGRG